MQTQSYQGITNNHIIFNNISEYQLFQPFSAPTPSFTCNTVPHQRGRISISQACGFEEKKGLTFINPYLPYWESGKESIPSFSLSVDIAGGSLASWPYRGQEACLEGGVPLKDDQESGPLGSHLGFASNIWQSLPITWRSWTTRSMRSSRALIICCSLLARSW